MTRFAGIGATNRDDLLWLTSHGSSLAEFVSCEREWKACACVDTLRCSKCLYASDPEKYIPNCWLAL